MSCYRLHTSLSLILWIFVLQHAPGALSTPLHELYRRHQIAEYDDNPRNLSELIEYEPLDFPLGAANVSVSSEFQEQAGGTQVSTFRLKTFLHVENRRNSSSLQSQGRQHKSESRNGVESSRNSSFGLSLDRHSWNKRTFIRSKIEPNKTGWSLDGIELAPGEVLDHVEEMQGSTTVPAASVNDSEDGSKPTAQDDKETKLIGLSLRDGGWKKKPFVRGFVERNGTESSLRDVQYVPGDISFEIPATWYPWLNHAQKLDEEKPKGDYGFRSTVDGNHRRSGETGSEIRKSSRVGISSSSELGGQSADDLEELEEYWFGPGKVEKLHYNQGVKAWRDFPENGRVLSRKRLSPGTGTPERQAREISFGLQSDNVPETFSNAASDEVTESIELTYDSLENHSRKFVSKDTKRSKDARSRQFVFHPYLPYGKDVPADEKIKFSDILPVRMVKFVKSMVEDAPWEQMFIKMVRMVVDQFVDKIIEKMFADKGHEHLKRRSIDAFLSDSWQLPSFGATPVIRVRRSVDANKQAQNLDELFLDFLSKRDPQNLDTEDKKTEAENKSWLDLFLDYAFPNSKSELSGDSNPERLTKRDTDSVHMFRVLVSYFVNYFEKTSEALTDAKDALRYKMLKDILPYLYQKRFPKLEASENTPSPVESLQMTPRDLKNKIRTGNEVLGSASRRGLVRNKRATEEAESKKDESRLWQEGSRRRKPHHRAKKNDCSLRRACNTGRLLARLPSVQEITMQLKSQGNEPHWDAMIWGMKKKRCSRIFCKRQRTPKGSRMAWFEDGPSARKLEIVTDVPDSAADIDR